MGCVPQSHIWIPYEHMYFTAANVLSNKQCGRYSIFAILCYKITEKLETISICDMLALEVHCHHFIVIRISQVNIWQTVRQRYFTFVVGLHVLLLYNAHTLY